MTREQVEVITVLILILMTPAVIAFLPVGECPVCPHCIRQRVNEARRTVMCPTCRQMVDVTQEHRHE